MVLLTAIFSVIPLVICQSDVERIENFIDEVMMEENIPGLSFASVKNGEPFLVRGFGAKNLESQEPVDENTLFFLGSTVKAMTGTLLSKALYMNGSFSLEDPIRPILGDTFHLADFYRTMNVNSKDVLAHRTNIATSSATAIFDAMQNMDDYMSRVQFWELNGQFRSGFFYSNTLVTLAGEIAAKLLNKTYADAMFDELFIPLGMDNTTFIHLLNDLDKQSTATAYYPDVNTGELKAVSLDAYSGLRLDAASGGAVSSATDLVKWVQFIINEGRNEQNQQIVEPDVLLSTQQPYMIKPSNNRYSPEWPVNIVEDDYGLGWDIGTYRAYKSIGHLGGVLGFNSKSFLLPDAKLGLFICVNGPNAVRAINAIERIAFFATDVLLGEEPWVNSTYPFMQYNNNDFTENDYLSEESIDIYEPVEEMYLSDLHNVTAYEGVYGNFAMGNITVTYNEGNLTAYYGKNGIFTLTPLNDTEHVFFAKSEDPMWWYTRTRLYFEVNEDGTPDTLIFPFLHRPFPPVFVRDRKLTDAPAPPDNCIRSN